VRTSPPILTRTGRRPFCCTGNGRRDQRTAAPPAGYQRLPTYLAGAGGLGWLPSPRRSVTGARRWTPVTVGERYIANGLRPLLRSRRPMPTIVANTTIPRRSITVACLLIRGPPCEAEIPGFVGPSPRDAAGREWQRMAPSSLLARLPASGSVLLAAVAHLLRDVVEGVQDVPRQLDRSLLGEL